jgi:hypothetical protein
LKLKREMMARRRSQFNVIFDTAPSGRLAKN